MWSLITPCVFNGFNIYAELGNYPSALNHRSPNYLTCPIIRLNSHPFIFWIVQCWHFSSMMVLKGDLFPFHFFLLHLIMQCFIYHKNAMWNHVKAHLGFMVTLVLQFVWLAVMFMSSKTYFFSFRNRPLCTGCLL